MWEDKRVRLELLNEVVRGTGQKKRKRPTCPSIQIGKKKKKGSVRDASEKTKLPQEEYLAFDRIHGNVMEKESPSNATEKKKQTSHKKDVFATVYLWLFL